MKSILCFGDSNTWGYDPDTGGRFDHNSRWTKIAEKRLAEKVSSETFELLEEGLNARTTVIDDPQLRDRCGIAFLPVAMETHMPFHMLLIALGANDLKDKYKRKPAAVAKGIGKLIECARSEACCPAHISIICPPPFSDVVDRDSGEFAGAVEKSLQLSAEFRKIAKRHSCGFLDAGEVIRVCENDGVHYDAAAHKALGELVAQHICEQFS